MKNYLPLSLFASILFFSCAKHNQKPQTQTPPLVLSDPEARNQEGTKLLGTSVRYGMQPTISIEWTGFRYEGLSDYLTQYADSDRALYLPLTDPSIQTGIPYTFNYDNSNILKSISNPTGVLNFYKNASGIIEKDSNILLGSGFYSSNSFFYNPAQQVGSMSISYSTDAVNFYYVKYMYDQSGNIVQTIAYDSSINSIKKLFTVIYQYDDKPNPLFPIKYINYAQARTEEGIAGPNNLISYQMTDSLGNSSGVDNFKFVYNSFNYPKYSIESSTGDTTKYYYY